MAVQVIHHGMKSIFRGALNVGNKLFNKYLLVTNCSVSIAMGATGDVIQQHYDILMGHQHSWKPLRTLHMAVAGLTTGVTCHIWYKNLDRWLPGRGVRIVAKKVLLDQILFSPVWISVYFATLGLLEGSASEIVKEELKEKGTVLYLTEWLIWPPAQMFNFYFLPTRYRVVFDNTISLGFDIYCPYLKYRYQAKKDEKQCDEHL